MASMIQIGARDSFKPIDLRSIYQLRAKVFQGRLGWEVAVLGGMEVDGYDALDPYYMMIRDDTQRFCGCWRLLPTTGPYMLKDTFPELLHGKQAPEDGQVWELSRFAIESGRDSSFGFAEHAMNAMREVVRFADDNGIVKYVTVTTTAIERLLRHAGIEMTRFGPPIRVGIEDAVALEIHLGQKTHAALFDTFH
ncbi:acyl-homoserine-lactone synthase [Duganella sp. S19_KUP01_CR8]|uniref:acyl-homoserine-lactone synthase n=1 Tax=Duganella sp. S19_KUP01_CR8 TaxID=3025502 RepID=UPI002FCDD445